MGINAVYWVELENVQTKRERSVGHPFHLLSDLWHWLKLNIGQFERARVYRIKDGRVSVNVKGSWVIVTGDEETGALVEIQRLAGKTLLEMVV